MPETPQTLRCGSRHLDLSAPVVMGVLNVTPDSFSDGGRWFEPARAVERARELVAEGAAIVDVGGESTRPGAQPPPVAEELRRVVPVIRALAAELDVVISVDTSRPEVAAAAVEAGAGLVNDVRGLRDPATLAAVAASGAAVCVMHMQGEPPTMQVAPAYVDVVAEVRAYLAERVAACRAAGIGADAIVVDPGFGFGKTLEHNLALFAALERFTTLGVPLLVGLSRKSLVGAVTGRPVEQRLAGSLAAAALAASRGARIVRAHDVAPTLDAVRMGWAARPAPATRSST
ncbi:MAG: dihydropteroate synthase [Pseudomonadota bacterium]|jgi:dihydropteroate synthase